MTKKDYEAIAAEFRRLREVGISQEADNTLSIVETALSHVMRVDNPRFDRARFLAACRGEDAKDSAGRTVRYSVSA